MDSPISAKAALLEVLLSGPGYGLDLIDRVKKKTHGKIVLGQGSVYPALHDLEEERLVESWEGEQRRVYFKLTPVGERAAMDQREVVLGLFPRRSSRAGKGKTVLACARRFVEGTDPKLPAMVDSMLRAQRLLLDLGQRLSLAPLTEGALVRLRRVEPMPLCLDGLADRLDECSVKAGQEALDSAQRELDDAVEAVLSAASAEKDTLKKRLKRRVRDLNVAAHKLGRLKENG